MHICRERVIVSESGSAPQMVVFWFLKQGSSAARFECAGLTPTPASSFLPTETNHERQTGSHFRPETGMILADISSWELARNL